LTPKSGAVPIGQVGNASPPSLPLIVDEAVEDTATPELVAVDDVDD
jgi:hypothetical protein